MNCRDPRPSTSRDMQNGDRPNNAEEDPPDYQSERIRLTSFANINLDNLPPAEELALNGFYTDPLANILTISCIFCFMEVLHAV